MNLSKSKYCNSIQCNKMLWLDTYYPNEKEDVSNSSVLDNGTDVGIIAKDLFGPHIDIKFNEDLKTMINDTKNLLLIDNIIITEASFLYNNNFCSVDILKKTGDNYEVYEVKSSTEVKEIFIDDISYQVYVLLNLGYNVTKSCIVHIDSSYVRYGDLELDKLFKIVDVTDMVLNKQDTVLKKINEINDFMSKETEPEVDIDNYCFKPYDCPFFKYCTRDLPKDTVFNIRGMRNSKKVSLYKDNLYRYQDLLHEKIDSKYKQQIEFELLNKKTYVNENNIREFLNTLSYPLYFLDFETFQQPIPKYDNVKPYMQIPFQYSIHYLEEENGILKHKEFLAEKNIDPRRKLAESLVNDIPLNVCTLAYNMSFEKMVIKNLALLYPDLSEHLLNIHDNIKDLMIPFYNRDYYTKDMHGSYSIKYVLPALFPDDPTLNYHNLNLIHNGSEAMNSYANLDKLSSEDEENIRYCLLKYCELDTYAMFKIYEKLKEI